MIVKEDKHQIFKKEYESPCITIVEFEISDSIASSGAESAVESESLWED